MVVSKEELLAALMVAPMDKRSVEEMVVKTVVAMAASKVVVKELQKGEQLVDAWVVKVVEWKDKQMEWRMAAQMVENLADLTVVRRDDQTVDQMVGSSVESKACL